VTWTWLTWRRGEFFMSCFSSHWHTTKEKRVPSLVYTKRVFQASIDSIMVLPGKASFSKAAAMPSEALHQQEWLACCTMLFQDAACQQLKDLAEKVSNAPCRCPPQLTGADMYALCADAWMNGLKRIIAEVRCMIR